MRRFVFLERDVQEGVCEAGLSGEHARHLAIWRCRGSNLLGRGIITQNFIFSPRIRALTRNRTASYWLSESPPKRFHVFMTTSSVTVPDDLNILHLHTAAYALLPVSQSLSSHLGSNLLATAIENDINLPESYTDTRLCPRCGTLYLPGVTCTVRTGQSRRQKRTAKHSTWVIYDCAVCKKSFRLEAQVPQGNPNKISPPLISKQGGKEQKAVERIDVSNKTGKRRKRDRLHGLRNAIEKAKTEKPGTELNLQDLMKVD